MPSVTILAEFSLFPDNTRLGPQFTLNGYEFADAGAPESFVNVSRTGTVKGLQFAAAGVRVTLPLETGSVQVRAAAFGGEFLISGVDSAGNVLTQFTAPADNQPHDYNVAHPGIKFVDFAGGGNEGTLLSISITLDCADR
ncbi:hypothetical protein [Longimicrobium sp.]|uniref:hypothetical protein n=1 Tax=Longimicrobium sp. TaxID=2029185 RepID=UPI002E300C1E|nr:hypothetical protein [Longimicrobium sp.]HEX6042426.1 hypothetical protein [Longimicrobium sp.]